jgi:DNA-binding GntR family transcriptional regulator
MRELEIVSIVDAIKEDLERRVLDGELRPGEHLREKELAVAYDVGRHTLRTAFDGLVSRGLLQKERDRGVFVRVSTERDLVEIYELRALLEAHAFRILAKNRHVPRMAVDALTELAGLDAHSPRHAVIEADLAFHRAMVEGAGNQRLARAHEGLGAETRLLLAQLVNGYATAPELAQEHSELVAVLTTGDPVMAEAAIRQHLDEAIQWLSGHLVAPTGLSPGAG